MAATAATPPACCATASACPTSHSRQFTVAELLPPAAPAVPPAAPAVPAVADPAPPRGVPPSSKAVRPGAEAKPCSMYVKTCKGQTQKPSAFEGMHTTAATRIHRTRIAHYSLHRAPPSQADWCGQQASRHSTSRHPCAPPMTTEAYVTHDSHRAPPPPRPGARLAASMMATRTTYPHNPHYPL